MTVQHPPVVHAGNAARLVREPRLDEVPFAVVEFVAHDSPLQFRSLNHGWGDGRVRSILPQPHQPARAPHSQ